MEKDWTEKHEVDRTDWFDVAESLPAQFFNPLVHPDRPYWSHVRSTVIGLLRIHGYLRANSDEFIPDIPGRIHPSWLYIFKVGNNDSRFPAGGYKLSPEEWYRLFDAMVSKRMKEADCDFIYNLFREGINKILKKQEDKVVLTEQSAEETSTPTQVVEDSEDYEGIPTLEEMRQIEDEEYARWFEGSL